jgi:hypothetical protein
MKYKIHEDKNCKVELFLMPNKRGLYILKSKITNMVISSIVDNVADLPYLSDNPFI